MSGGTAEDLYISNVLVSKHSAKIESSVIQFSPNIIFRNYEDHSLPL